MFTSFAYSDGTNPITNVGDYGSLTWTNTGNTLTWSAVPEPTSALAGLLLGAGPFSPPPQKMKSSGAL